MNKNQHFRRQTYTRLISRHKRNSHRNSSLSKERKTPLIISEEKSDYNISLKNSTNSALQKEATSKKSKEHISKLSKFRNKQKKLHNRDISEKNQALNSASTKKKNIQSSIQEEVKQLKELKKTLKAQKKELKLTNVIKLRH